MIISTRNPREEREIEMKKIMNITSTFRGWLGLITFKSSEKYWINRYKEGGNSGYGSYGKLARFKADILNDFVDKNSVNTTIEYGCGDGHQLSLAKYPHYIGYDISPAAIWHNKRTFIDDRTKYFYLLDDYKGEKADLTLSLDVIYHLTEDDVFEKHTTLLFQSSLKYVIVYSTNYDYYSFFDPHIKHRHFTKWVEINLPGWKLINHIPNKFSRRYLGNSKADFFIYQNQQAS